MVTKQPEKMELQEVDTLYMKHVHHKLMYIMQKN